MDITLVRSTTQRKNPRLVIFKIEGRAGSVQFFRPLFGEAIPDTLTLTGEFAQPKPRLTPEERKARQKARPKPTAAEKVAQMEKQLAKMRARLAAAPPEPDCVLPQAPSTSPEKNLGLVDQVAPPADIAKFIQPDDGIVVTPMEPDCVLPMAPETETATHQKKAQVGHLPAPAKPTKGKK